MNTDCSKCKAPMEKPPVAKGPRWLDEAFTITGYRCKQCGHWNDLKRRKGWKDRQK